MQVGDELAAGADGARPSKLKCACCGAISLSAAVSCMVVVGFRMLLLSEPLSRLILEGIMIAFFFIFAWVTWPPAPDACCYASCSDWCCSCDECCACEESAECHACNYNLAWMCLTPCMLLCASDEYCARCRDHSCYGSFLGATLGWLTVLDMMSVVWACWGDVWSIYFAYDEYCAATAGGLTMQVLLELFYGPLLFVFVFWNIARYMDRWFLRSFELFGGVKLAHRARKEHLVTDALAWGPFLVVQLICAASIGGVLAAASVLIGEERGYAVSSEAVFIALAGGIPVTVWVYLLATFGDCRLAALWAAASAPPPVAVPLPVPVPDQLLPQTPVPRAQAGTPGDIHRFDYRAGEHTGQGVLAPQAPRAPAPSNLVHRWDTPEFGDDPAAPS